MARYGSYIWCLVFFEFFQVLQEGSQPPTAQEGAPHVITFPGLTSDVHCSVLQFKPGS